MGVSGALFCVGGEWIGEKHFLGGWGWVVVMGNEWKWVGVCALFDVMLLSKKTHFTKYLEISKMKFECLHSYIRILSENIRL